MTNSIIDIEGIGPVYAEKLGKAGIKTTGDLIARCLTPKDRAALAPETECPERLILKWANMADLMRIKGVGEEYSELLEAAGVDTVKELKLRRADNLHARMAEVNAAKSLVRQLPSAAAVATWIEEAKELPPTLTY